MNFIFTGCAGAGKTTLIDYLSTVGYTCYEEVSRKIIKEQLAQNSNAVPWRNTTSFCRLVFEKMLQHLPPASDEICFLDRGIPDVIAYLKAVNHAVPDIYYQVLKQANYAPIAFLFPPNEDIYINDNERQESFEEALFFFEAIQETYQILGFKLYTVPLMPLEDRSKYILDIAL